MFVWIARGDDAHGCVHRSENGSIILSRARVVHIEHAMSNTGGSRRWAGHAPGFPQVGCSSTLAVLFHELPHEVGDVAILMQATPCSAREYEP